MKRIVLFLVAAVVIALPGRAQQPETLVTNGVSSGGFGGPLMRFTEVHGEFGVLLGGHGGWIINHQFIIGGGGYGLAGDMVNVNAPGIPGGRTYLTFGYGGLELQYVIRPMKLVHYWVSGLIGGGSARGRQNGMWMTGDDAVFVAEPGGGVTVNLTRAIRIDAGASYRLVSGATVPWWTNGDLSGPSGMLAVSFGSF